METKNSNEITQENSVPKPFSETLAMEMLKDERRKHKAKDLGLWIMGGITAIALIAGGIERRHLVNTNLQNDQEWRELFSQYDYVSQDGNGQNYYNSGVGGNVNNGTESTESEEQE